MPGADVYHLDCIMAATKHLRIKTVKPVGPPLRLIGETSAGIEPHMQDIECYRNMYKSRYNVNPREYPATQEEMDEAIAQLDKVPLSED